MLFGSADAAAGNATFAIPSPESRAPNPERINRMGKLIVKVGNAFRQPLPDHIDLKVVSART